jgi:hypothetical protein
MKTTLKLMLVALVLGSSTVVHAAAGDGSTMGLGAFLFLGFLALILVFQMVPGLILFFTMLKGLFSPGVKENSGLVASRSKESL